MVTKVKMKDFHRTGPADVDLKMLSDGGDRSPSFCAQQHQISNCPQRDATPGHVGLNNSLVGKKAFLEMLRKALPGYRRTGCWFTVLLPKYHTYSMKKGAYLLLFTTVTSGRDDKKASSSYDLRWITWVCQRCTKVLATGAECL